MEQDNELWAGLRRPVGVAVVVAQLAGLLATVVLATTVGLAATAAPASADDPPSVPQIVTCTGGYYDENDDLQTRTETYGRYEIPPFVHAVQVVVVGTGGNTGGEGSLLAGTTHGGGTGGHGTKLTATIPVVHGTVPAPFTGDPMPAALYWEISGRAGGGGGTATPKRVGNSREGAGAEGGPATWVGTTAPVDTELCVKVPPRKDQLVAVAAGGGGGGGGTGNAGPGATGGTETRNSGNGNTGGSATGGGGKGATTAGPGAGGTTVGCGEPPTIQNGFPGTEGPWGTGGKGSESNLGGNCGAHGGGGGGGYFGGGGGAQGSHLTEDSGGGGGGAGASWTIPTATNVTKEEAFTEPPGVTLTPIYDTVSVQPSMTLTSSANSTRYGREGFRLTATLSQSTFMGETIRGTVAFVDETEARVLGTVDVVDGKAAFDVSSTALTTTTHSLSARYSGFGGADNVSVIKPTTATRQQIVIQAPLPTAPQNVQMMRRDGKATITFEPSADAGAAPIQAYLLVPRGCPTIGAPTGSFSTGLPTYSRCADAVASVPPSARSFEVTGLLNGVGYPFDLVATNANGAGDPTLVVANGQAAGVPGAPAPLTVVDVGHQRVDLSFTPAERTAKWFEVWTYTDSPARRVSITYVPNFGTPTQTVRIGGLTNGLAHHFEVFGFSNADAGAAGARAVTGPVTPHVTVPDGPSTSAASGDGSIVLTVERPSSGGLAVDSISAAAIAPNGSTQEFAFRPVNPSTVFPMTVTLPNLVTGQTYSLRVIAHNALGDSAPAVVQPSSVRVQAKPKNVIASIPLIPGGARADVSFVPPLGDVGIFRVSSSPDTATGQVFTADATVVAPSDGITPVTVSVMQLSQGGTYTFTVRHVDFAGAGDGPVSDPSNPVVPVRFANPSPPTNISVFPGGSGALRLLWEAGSDGGTPLTGFQVIDQDTLAVLADVGPAARQATVGGLVNGQGYRLALRAISAVGPSVTAPYGFPVTPFALGAPLDPQAAAGRSSATVSFEPPEGNGGPGPTSYTVTSRTESEESEDPADPVTHTATGAASPITITGLIDGVTYTFDVHAAAEGADTPASVRTNAVTPNGLLPGQPTAVAATGGIAQATVTFAPPLDGGPVFLYTVTAHPGGMTQKVQGLGVEPLSTTFLGLDNDRPYFFTVNATYLAGTGAESLPSNTVTPARLLQASFTTPAVGTYGQTLDAPTGGSTIQPLVTVASGGACTIVSGGRIQLTHATDASHTCDLAVTRAGDGTYQDASARRAVAVAPRAATVRVLSAITTYGEAAPIQLETTGLLTGEDLGSLDCQQLGVDAGTHLNALTCSGGTNPNYAPSFVAGNLQIEPRPVIVRPRAQTIAYGDDPDFGFDVDGLQLDESLSGIVCTISAGRLHVGTYEILCTGNTNGNYAAQYLSAPLTVTRRPATLTVTSATRPFGDPNAPLTATTSGLVDGDHLEYQLDTPADDRALVGIHPINANLGPNPDYDVTVVPGTVTIEPRAITVTADPQTHPLAQPDRTLTHHDKALAYRPLVGVTCDIAGPHAVVGRYDITCTGGADPNYAITYVTGHLVVTPVVSDFDGDGDSDIAVYRPSTGDWFAIGQEPVGYGAPGPEEDVSAAADYDGDGRTDIAVFRPSSGEWFVRGRVPVGFGAAGDIPVPADYDGDGDADVAVFRPSTGQWFVAGQFTVSFGTSGDVPVPADYDGDGDSDVAVFRPSTGQWFVAGQFTVSFGTSGDVPVPADYDGDGDSDVAVFRPSTGEWFAAGLFTVSYGTNGDVPVPGDYDGDGAADVAVFRPTDGIWYFANQAAVGFGAPNDAPVPGPRR